MIIDFLSNQHYNYYEKCFRSNYSKLLAIRRYRTKAPPALPIVTSMNRQSVARGLWRTEDDPIPSGRATTAPHATRMCRLLPLAAPFGCLLLHRKRSTSPRPQMIESVPKLRRTFEKIAISRRVGSTSTLVPHKTPSRNRLIPTNSHLLPAVPMTTVPIARFRSRRCFAATRRLVLVIYSFSFVTLANELKVDSCDTMLLSLHRPSLRFYSRHH